MSTSAERKADLARRWESVKLSIGRAQGQRMSAFRRSRRYWQTGEIGGAASLLGAGPFGSAVPKVVSKMPRLAPKVGPELPPKGWTVREPGDLYFSRSFTGNASILIEGDCRADLSLPTGGLVQILGDLRGRIEIGERIEFSSSGIERGVRSEVVIGGDVLPGAMISAGGWSEVFVEGNLNGTVQSGQILDLWVGGHVGGSIDTGDLRTCVHVEGDVAGEFRPAHIASFLCLNVNGFMSYSLLESIVRRGYTEFDANIGSSDKPPGIYPEPAETAAKERHECWWTIQAMRPPLFDSAGVQFPADLGPPSSDG